MRKLESRGLRRFKSWALVRRAPVQEGSMHRAHAHSPSWPRIGKAANTHSQFLQGGFQQATCGNKRQRRPIRLVSSNMTVAFLLEAVKGIQAEVESTGSLKVVPRSILTFGRELAALVPLIPAGIRLASLYRSLDSLQSYLDAPKGGPARAPRLDVLLHRAQQYGPASRHTMDVYVPRAVAEQLRSRTRQAAGTPAAAAPVVLFTHGGVWASGEPWHYASMAIRLAQAGCVVVCHTYTLYPDALVPQMVQEVNAALSWTLDHISAFGGDPQNVSATGHSAGGHLVALALMQRAGLQICGPPCAPLEQQSAAPMPPPISRASGPPASGWTAPAAYTTIALEDDTRMPARFVGLAGVFDIAKHYEHERSRGVHIISMMTRAMGGRDHFGQLSPSVILSRLERGQPPSTQSQPCTFTPQAPARVEGVPSEPVHLSSFFTSFALMGDAIPHRVSGQDSAALGWAPGPAGSTAEEEAAGGSCTEASGSQYVEGGPAGGAGDSAALQAARQAVRRLPPCFMLAGCSDHVVPWHETAEFVTRLNRCGAPARLLLYQQATHACFVMGFTPLRQATQAAPRGDPSKPLEHDDPLLVGMSDWSKDIVRIVMGAPGAQASIGQLSKI